MQAQGAGLWEEDVGIFAFANNAPPFDAILRHRISDFTVNEVSLDMEVAAPGRSQVQLTKPAPVPSWHSSEGAEKAEQMVGDFAMQAAPEHVAALRAFIEELTTQVLPCHSTGCWRISMYVFIGVGWLRRRELVLAKRACAGAAACAFSSGRHPDASQLHTLYRAQSVARPHYSIHRCSAGDQSWHERPL